MFFFLYCEDVKNSQVSYQVTCVEANRKKYTKWLCITTENVAVWCMSVCYAELICRNTFQLIIVHMHFLYVNKGVTYLLTYVIHFSGLFCHLA